MALNLPQEYVADFYPTVKVEALLTNKCKHNMFNTELFLKVVDYLHSFKTRNLPFCMTACD